jgi:hypothetical protein
MVFAKVLTLALFLAALIAGAAWTARACTNFIAADITQASILPRLCRSFEEFRYAASGASAGRLAR